MIHIPFKEEEITISIPKNTDYTGSFTLRITSELTFKKYDFDVTDEGNSKRYYKFTVDFSEVEDAEYRYFLIQDDVKVTEGLIQIGDLTDSIPSVIFYDAFQGRENVQYYPETRSYIILHSDTHLTEDASAITYSVRTNVPSSTQMFIRHHTQTEWSPWPPESHTENQYTEIVDIGPNVEDFPRHFKVVATTQDGTASASTEIVQDAHYYFDVDVYSPSSAIPASATELSYGIQYSEYQSAHIGTFFIYKNDVLIKEQPFGWYPYGFSTYMEIEPNESFVPVTYKIVGILDNGQSDSCEVTQEASTNYRAMRFRVEMLGDGDINWNVTGIYYNLNPDGGPDQNREIGQYYDPNDRKWKYGINNLHTGDVVEFYVTEDVTQIPRPLRWLTSTADHKVYGNVMSLHYVNFAEVSACTFDYQFASLFGGDKGLIDASNLSLPAEVLSERCYSRMFENCSNLEVAPKLPATYLAPDCYTAMFMDCNSLVDAPALPATNLATRCYYAMFSGCISLVNAPALPSESLTAECYSGMFVNCSALIYAPKLPAQYLVYKCYDCMFWGCSNLNYIECLAIYGINENPADPYPNTRRWVEGVSATGEFYTADGSEWQWGRGVDEIPEGWDVNP